MCSRAIRLVVRALVVATCVISSRIVHCLQDKVQSRTVSISDFYPTQGSELGGTQVHIIGSSSSGFVSSKDKPYSFFCVFGGERVAAYTVQDNVLECVTPEGKPGLVPLYILQEGEDDNIALNITAGSFTYTILAAIHSVIPSFAYGSVKVNLLGSGFQLSESLSCRFGDHKVKATFITSTNVSCITPDLHHPSSMLVTVSNNGLDVEGSWCDVFFTFTLPTIVTSIDPVIASNSGGTNIFIVGENLDPGSDIIPVCIFDGVYANATLLGDDGMVCTTPRMDSIYRTPKMITVLVSLNGGFQTALGEHQQLLVHPPLKLSMISPTSILEMNAANITVYGQNFPSTEYLRCTFGARSVVAIWQSTSIIRCEVPPLSFGMINLGVSTNNQAAGRAMNTIQLMVHEPIHLFSITPTRGSSNGGTIITLKGSGFTGASTLLCQFDDVVIATSTVYNETTADCVVPPASPKQLQARIVISTKYSTSETLTYWFIQAPLVESIHPTMGSIDGGTRVSVTGNFLDISKHNVGCLFSFSSMKSIRMHGNKVTNTTIDCITPNISYMNLTEAVSFVSIVTPDFDEDIDRGAPFLFQPSIVMESLYPESGTEFGGTKVYIYGRFPRSKDFVCRFDGEPSPNTRWLSLNLLTCVSPPATKGSFLVAPIKITVSMNGQDEESSSLLFTYTPQHSIHGIEPTFGYVSGGYSAYLTGNSFSALEERSLGCMFGDIRAHAMVVNNSVIRCQVPPSEFEGAVRVRLYFNDDDTHRDLARPEALYTYIPDPVIEEIYPDHVSHFGGERVYLRGYNFTTLHSDIAWCLVGNNKVEARVESNSLISFSAPVLQESQTLRILLSLNGQEYIKAGPMLSFMPSPQVHSVSPPFCHEESDWDLTLRGEGFYNISGLSCRFKAASSTRLVIEALYLSSTEIKCSCPRVLEYGITSSMSLELSQFNNRTLSEDVKRVQLSYYEKTTVTSIEPSILPSNNVGSEVRVLGQGFYKRNQPYFCKVKEPEQGSTTYSEATRLSDIALKCIVTAPNQNITDALVSIVVRQDDVYYNTGGDDSAGSISSNVRFLQEFLLEKVTPNSFSAAGGDSVEIFGSHFFESSQMLCSFTIEGRIYATTAYYQSEQIITCRSPSLERTSSQLSSSFLQVMINGIVFSANDLNCFHRLPMAMHWIEPPLVQETGGTNLTIVGSNFYDARPSSTDCVFRKQTAESIVPARYISTELISCTAPSLLPGEYFVSIRIGDNDVAAKRSALTVFERFSIDEIFPHFGPIEGGTRVILRTKSIIHLRTSLVLCSFGANGFSKGSITSSREVTCVSPKQHKGWPEINVKVGVSLNTKDFVYSQESFSYIKPARIKGMYPTSGSVYGGTEVTLYGENLNMTGSQFMIMFGNVSITDVILMNDDTLRVTAPDIRHNKDSYASSVRVRLSTNGGVDFSDGPKFAYTNRAKLLSIYPRNGPLTGGTKLTLSGMGFHPNPSARCKFGEDGIKNAYVLSSNLVECTVTPANRPGLVSVDFSSNGVDWTDSGLFYEYSTESIEIAPKSTTKVSVPIVYQITPQFGPTRGNTPLLLSLRGDLKDGRNGTYFHCAFYLDDDTVYMTTASLIKSNLLTCLSPKIVLKDDRAIIHSTVKVAAKSISDSADDHDFGMGGTTFSFKAFPTAMRMIPIGGAFNGGTVIKISIATRSRSIFLNTDSLSCKFGANEIVKAAWISDYLVECVSPPVVDNGAFASDLLVSENAVDYSLVGRYHYFDEPFIERLEPLLIFANTTNTINIYGSGFVSLDQPTCLFKNAVTHAETLAKFLNKTKMECLVPESSNEITYNVYASNNGFDFSSTYIELKVIQRPVISRITPSRGIIGHRSIVKVHGQFIQPDITWGCYLNTDMLHADCEDILVLSTSEMEIEIVCPTTQSSTLYRLKIMAQGLVLNESTYLCSHESFSPPVSKFPYDDALLFTETFDLTGEERNTEQLYLDSRAHAQDPVSAMDDNFVGVFVRRISPSSGSIKGDTEVVIDGRNFTQSTQYLCRFGVKYVSLEVISTNMAICKSPNVVQPILHKLSIVLASSRSVVSISSSFEEYIHDFIYYEDPQLLSVIPSVLSVHGDSMVIINGTWSFDYANVPLLSPRCKFGDVVKVAIHFDPKGSITCEQAPIVGSSWRSTQTKVPISVSLNGVDYSRSTVVVTYVDSIRIRSIAPDRGTVYGGSNMRIFLLRSNELCSNVQCKFGEYPSTFGFYKKQTQSIMCQTPRAMKPGTVKIHLMYGPQREWHDTGFNFTFEEDVVVANVAKMDEKFNLVEEARRLAKHSGQANESKMDVEESSMERVSTIYSASTETDNAMNKTEHLGGNEDHSLVSMLMNEGYDIPAVNSLWPSIVSSNGGTIVSVIGSNFLTLAAFNGEKIRLKSDNEAYDLHTLARIVDDSSFQFVVPYARNISSVEIHLHVFDTFIETGFQLTFQPEVVVESLAPLQGGDLGGYPLSITGLNFNREFHYSCVFSSSWTEEVPRKPAFVAEADIISDSSLVCKVPSASNVFGDHVSTGMAKFQIRRDDDNSFSNSLSFLYTNADEDFILPIEDKWGDIAVEISDEGETPQHKTVLSTESQRVEWDLALSTILQQDTSIVSEELNNDSWRFEDDRVVDSPVLDTGSSDEDLANKTVGLPHVLSNHTAESQGKIEKLKPRYGPEGDSIISIYGSGFVNKTGLSCMVGNASPRKAFFKNSSFILCSVPRAIEAFGSNSRFRKSMLGGLAKTFVSVSNNGLEAMNTTSNSQEVSSYLYYENPIITKVYPTEAVPGTMLIVHLSHIPAVNFESPLCRFDAVTAVAKVFTETTLTCKVPLIEYTVQKKLDISVSLNGIHFSDLYSHFNYVESTFYMTKVYKEDVLSKVDTKQKVCCEEDIKFHHVESYEYPIRTQRSLTESTLKVGYDTNEDSAESSDSRYQVRPTTDPQLEIPRVSLHNDSTSLDGEVHARSIEDEEVTETEESVSMVSHQSPLPYEIRQQVENNDRNEMPNEINLLQRSVEVQPSAQVISIHPNHGPVGCHIIVYGLNFREGLHCHFGAENFYSLSTSPTFTEFINDTHIACKAPVPLRIEKVAFYLSYNDERFSGKSNTLTFTYDNILRMERVIPPSGPSYDNFNITIFGGPFIEELDENELLCKFGSTVVTAYFISEKQVWCMTPPMVAGLYPLKVTMNGQDFSENFLPIRFYDKVTISKITPVTGPDAGSTLVRLISDEGGLFNSTGSRCRFGGKIVPATFISETELTCRAPPLSIESLHWESLDSHTYVSTDTQTRSPFISDAHNYPRYLSKFVTVDFTMNNQDYSGVEHWYLYQKDVTITRIVVTRGDPIGDTPIFIQGSDFVNNTNLLCRFGHHVRNATFLARDTILCFSPPQSHMRQEYSFRSTEVEVSLEVSNNGVHFSRFNNTFEFKKPASPGYYQAGTEEVSTKMAPRGSFSPGHGNRNFTLCFPGTYQPNRGQSECLRCPIGFMCPDFGMHVPRICSAGYVCDVTGTQKADQPCPAGFYCHPGTGTTATLCGDNHASTDGTMSTTNTLAERSSTLRAGFEPLGDDPIYGGRKSLCIDNSTTDFGLQVSNTPARVWDELRQLPLDSDTVSIPLRGRFCLDDSCLDFKDLPAHIDLDEAYDTSYQGISVTRRPVPCPEGSYCHPGTSSNDTTVGVLTTPQPCFNSNYCPEGTPSPLGLNEGCEKGFFCRFGRRFQCPIGHFCEKNSFEPTPCFPGTFNHLVGQFECTDSPHGHYVSEYGAVDAALCPAGYVCSKTGLTAPNLRCVKGFYCLQGTRTSDPFRNDTSLRPYPCSPGSYCLDGVGNNTIKDGDFFYAQPCAEGFYCEAASISAHGAGLCPKGFTCKKGTAIPTPTKKGHYSKLPGSIQSTTCLPGFYAPTIETTQCYPCPPGTACEFEGMYEAEICPPGTYRSKDDGIPCVSCPEGTWSKNWQLRQTSECTTLAPGLVSRVSGMMTNPCSKNDLPTPFEPILNLNGKPVLEYMYSVSHPHRPPAYTLEQCLQLNFNDTIKMFSDNQQFFYGELIPPYIDILGRGAYLRPSDEISAKYGHNTVKCYRNSRPQGSIIYNRLKDFHGPRYDIHNQYPNQGYGSRSNLNLMFEIEPYNGVLDKNLKYHYGRGSMYIDLPHSTSFNPSFNCTPGFHLMNSSLVPDDRIVVYTNGIYDHSGGTDVEKCPHFDENLDCYVDPTYETHGEGQCCSIKPWNERAIFLAEDQYYDGTCEADLICSEEHLGETSPTADGYVGKAGSYAIRGISLPCSGGFVCGLGTTPDESLFASASQYKTLCRMGSYCEGGNGLLDEDVKCGKGYICPTGTRDPMFGSLADDSLKRNLRSQDIDPNKEMLHLLYLGDDVFYLSSDHDARCLWGADVSLSERRWSHGGSEIIERGEGGKNIGLSLQTSCSRDHKWRHVEAAIRRDECDCVSQMVVVAAVYRLWKCTNITFNGPQTPRRTEKKNSTQWTPMCNWPDSSSLSLTTGRLPYQGEYMDDGIGGRRIRPQNAGRAIPSSTGGFLSMHNYGLTTDPDVKFLIQYSYSEQRMFANYQTLKRDVLTDYHESYRKVKEGEKVSMDPFIFDLYHSIELIEMYGEDLEEIVYFEVEHSLLHGDQNHDRYLFEAPPSTALPIRIHLKPGRLDICGCQNLLKCANGTSSMPGSDKMEDCAKSNDEVLSRISMISASSLRRDVRHKLKNTTDFSEISGSITTPVGVGSVVLDSTDVAIFSLNMTDLPTNLTYGDHYKLAVYEKCKPCPTRYICGVGNRFCENMPLKDQYGRLNSCLRKYRVPVCMHRDGYAVNATWCEEELKIQSQDSSTDSQGLQQFRSTYLMYQEPDLHKCLSLPLFCDDISWRYRTFRRLCYNKKDGKEYDCSMKEQWDVYSAWRNDLCCSGTAEFNDISACIDNQCADDDEIEVVIQKYKHKFHDQYGFKPPLSKPEGVFLMDAHKQEALEHEKPFDLFNEWKQYRTGNSSASSEHHTTQVKNQWLKSDGCCRCQPHNMPPFFNKNIQQNGFPDDKHQQIQLTVTALQQTEVTAVLELLHGQHYSSFHQYFDSDDKINLQIHSPYRFAKEHSMWMSFLSKETLDTMKLNPPLNLPSLQSVSKGSALLDTILLDSPKAMHSTTGISVMNKTALTRGNVTTNDAFPSHDENDIDRYLEKTLQHDDRLRRRSELSADVGNIDFSSVLLPYIPFLSNCEGFDSRLSLSRLLDEHSGCTIIHPANTKHVRQNPFHRQFEPLADMCMKEDALTVLNTDGMDGVDIQCQYDEQVNTASESLRWFELASRSIPFHLTKEPMPSQLLTSYNSRDFKAHHSNSRRDWMVPVMVDDVYSGMRHVLPRTVMFELQYFQVDQYHKRLVKAKLYYNDLCTTIKPVHFGGNAELLRQMAELNILPCKVDINGNLKSYAYDLKVLLYPLNWFHLFNRFEFGTAVYLAAFTVIGLCSGLLGLISWGVNRMMTKLRNPPDLRLYELLELTMKSSCLGTALAIIPISICFFGVYWQFLFSDGRWFESINSSWQYQAPSDATKTRVVNIGRTGTSLLVLGAYLSFVGFTLITSSKNYTRSGEIVEDKDSKTTISTLVAPWKRNHTIWCSLCFNGFLLCIWEMSYSSSFRSSIFTNVLVLRLLHTLVDYVLVDVLDESLLCAPFFVTFAITESIVVMGSSDFVGFTLVFMIQTSSSIVQRLYVHPCLKSLKSISRRWKFLFFRWWFSNRQITLRQKEEQTVNGQKIDELIEARAEGVEPIIDAVAFFSAQLSARLLYPPLLLLLSSFYDQTKVAENYGLDSGELRYFLLFSFYMIPWLLVVDILLMNAQELMHGWRIYDYLIYQRHRFQSREEGWVLKSNAFDGSIPESIQSLDLLSFSSQYYFLLSLIASGMTITLLAITIYMRTIDYNFLADPATPIVSLTMFLFCQVVRYSVIKLASMKIKYLDWQGLWKTNAIEGTLDDMIATKLTIGDSGQIDLDRKRQELDALNNDEFRVQFLERNRPWILHNLAELIRPQELSSSIDINGLSIAEYVKDIYSDLLDEKRHQSSTSEISSDEDDNDELFEKWGKSTVTKTTKTIAKLWLSKANKRKKFRKAVEGIAEQKKRHVCSACSRTRGSCASMDAYLATGGKRDSSKLDSLMNQFENDHPTESGNMILWKSYFKMNARFITLCNYCVDKSNTREVMVKEEGFSSDEEDYTRHFDPIVIEATSAEGNVMMKWLSAARKKLGGEFPRQDASMRVEAYLAQLKLQRQRRLRGSVSTKTPAMNTTTLADSSQKLLYDWLSSAKDNISDQFLAKGQRIRQELKLQLRINKQISNDVYLEGQELLREGSKILEDRLDMMEKEDQAKQRMKVSIDTANVESNAEKIRKRKQTERSMKESMSKVRISGDLRIRELYKSLDTLRRNPKSSIEPNASYDDTISQLQQSIREEEERVTRRIKKIEKEMASDLRHEEGVIARSMLLDVKQSDHENKLMQEKHRLTWQPRENAWRSKASIWLDKVSRSGKELG